MDLMGLQESIMRADKALEPRLTIKGMEFLQENSAMQKIKNGLKDIKEVTPFI